MVSHTTSDLIVFTLVAEQQRGEITKARFTSRTDLTLHEISQLDWSYNLSRKSQKQSLGHNTAPDLTNVTYENQQPSG